MELEMSLTILGILGTSLITVASVLLGFDNYLIIDINKRFNINNTKLTYTSFPKIFSDFNIKIEDTTPTGIIKINPTITLLKYIFLSAIGNIFFIQIHFPSSESETWVVQQTPVSNDITYGKTLMLSLINPYGISNGLTPIPFLLKKTLSEKNSMSIRPSAVFKTYVGIEPYCLSSPIKTAIFFFFGTYL